MNVLTLTDFLFAEAQIGKPIEVLRVGTFMDRHGHVVEISGKDLDAIVANFQAGTAGQEVPIDVNHEKGEAGGWIRGLMRDGEKLLAIPEWNELGRRLVNERIYRYLSAWVDLAEKFIKSVSLVNFPAVKGLKPVELGEGVYSFQAAPGLVETLVARVTQVMDVLGKGENPPPEEVEKADIRKEGNEIVLYSSDGEKVLSFPFGESMEYATEEAAREAALKAWLHTVVEDVIYQNSGGNTMTDEERAALKEQLRQEILTEMADEQQTLAELREQVRVEVEAEMAEKMAKRTKLREFAEEVTGSDFGLAAKPEEIVELLEVIEDEEHLQKIQAMLKAKVVDFSERGSSREGQGGKQKLPAVYVELARTWQEQGHDLTEFFEVNKDELGSMDQYDLNEFEKKE